MKNKFARIFVLVVMLAGAAGCERPNAPWVAQASSGVLVIHNGTVIDGTGVGPISKGFVIIEGEHIIDVGPEINLTFPAEAYVINAGGGTILPGIIDSHVHTAWSPETRRAFLESGITTVCDLGSPIERMGDFTQNTWNDKQVARGYRTGPIITAVGGLPGAILDKNLNYEVANPEEARAAVIDLHNRGADIIKVYLHQESNKTNYPMLGEDELEAIVEQAHTLGLLVRAHVTYAGLLEMAVDASVDVIEHTPVNTTEAEDKNISIEQWVEIFDQNFKRMVDAEILMVPTLDRPFGKYFRDADSDPEIKNAIEMILSLVGLFHEMGGDIGLGTDWAPGTGMETGIPVGEIEMLMAAGLTPLEVIQSSTQHAAYVCGHGDELGTLEPGKLADLIVVEGNPLDDIAELAELQFVIKNGEIVVADGIPVGVK